MRGVRDIEQELGSRVEDLGFELVDVRWGGSSRRPQLKVRVDVPRSEPGRGVSVADCASVSRALEAWLDDSGRMPERYVLEVSSPGVERPLVRDQDFERFVGRPVALKGHDVLAGRARRLEGELLGLEHRAGDDEGFVCMRLQDGTEVRIGRSEISGANLVFRWR